MLTLPKLKIGNLTSPLPIIQGGMGVGISMAGLASAVANAGGIGVLSSVGLGLINKSSKNTYKEDNIHNLRAEIRKAKRKTKGILGLNIMIAINDFDEMVTVALEEDIDIIFLGAGLPLKLPKCIDRSNIQSIITKVAPIVSSARATRLILKSWDKNFNYIPDAFVVEGPLAGGHLGFKLEQINDPNYCLEKLIPEIVAEVKIFEQKYDKHIPIIAAGGIFTGEDILRFVELGAQGVQLGTRFVATDECDADEKFKNQFVQCKQDDIVIIKSPVGLPGRAINSDFLRDVNAGIKRPFKCPWKCLKTCNFKTSLYCIADALKNAKFGDLKNGFCFAGANAWRIDKIIPVKELMDSLVREFECAVIRKKVLI